jgi:hypothetical protein
MKDGPAVWYDIHGFIENKATVYARLILKSGVMSIAVEWKRSRLTAIKKRKDILCVFPHKSKLTRKVSSGGAF